MEHGAWLRRFYDRPTKAVMIFLENPLLAVTMPEHEATPFSARPPADRAGHCSDIIASLQSTKIILA